MKGRKEGGKYCDLPLSKKTKTVLRQQRYELYENGIHGQYQHI